MKLATPFVKSTFYALPLNIMFVAICPGEKSNAAKKISIATEK